MRTQREAPDVAGQKRRNQQFLTMDEVDTLLAGAVQNAEQQQAALARQSETQRQLLTANEKQAQTIAAYHAKLLSQETLLAEQEQEIAELGRQLALYRAENLTQSEQIAVQTVQISRLQSHLGTQQEQLTALESQTTDELRAEAARKADEIVARAIADSDRILAQATEQRTRLIAACRAAYYSALQFKQDLAEQFRNMERELDASIDVLRFMDNSRMPLQPTGQDGEPAGGSQTL